MLVAVHVSSMKTSRSGARSIWSSNQSWRCFRMSGRSCSMAWPVFFCASCRAARRSGEARPRRRSAQSRSAPDAVPQARCPDGLPIWQGFPLAAPRPDATAPRALGAKSPVSRRCASQRITVDGATPNRTAAPRQLMPPSIAAKARARKSIDRGWPIRAGLLHQHAF